LPTAPPINSAARFRRSAIRKVSSV
jgi:hypothetical protein